MTFQTEDNSALSREEVEKKHKEWMQQEYTKTIQYCNRLGFQVDRVMQTESQCLPPIIGIWRVRLKEESARYIWVISGQVATDHIHADNAKSPREVLRHFSLSWQLKAERLQQGIETGKLELKDAETQKKFAATLIQNADNLYGLYENDKLWQQTSKAMKI